MTLGDVALDVPVSVTRVGGTRSFRRRLMELGVLPGTILRIVRVAPLGDPLELAVRGCFLSIRKQDARFVDVAIEQSHAQIATSATVAIQPGLPASS